MPQQIGPARRKAVELRKANPNMTLEAIANQCGITKQRVYKIFQDEGIPRRPKVQRTNVFKSCKNCGILISNKKYCDDKCREEALYTELPCSYCGKPKKHRKYIVFHKLKNNQYNFFCSKACFHLKQRKS